MFKYVWILIWLTLTFLVGCGPDTIFVRPGLDTPDQHVSNGYRLLRRGKLDDAQREFSRAMELDSEFVRAYVGLGVTMGRKGDIEASARALERAGQLAVTPHDREAVQDGYRQMCEIRCRDELAPATP